MVEVERPEEDPAIQLYRAWIKNGTPEQSCTIMACIPPLQCAIPHLAPTTNYAVEVKACVPGKRACGAIKEEEFTLKPPT